ncbi:MAG: hypothetical protein V3R78_10495, partial [Thermodesulfobacteriota bacterium]
FCEGPGFNGCMVEIMWHRRETRRKQRKQTSTCSIGRNRSTRLNPLTLPLSLREIRKDYK